MDPRLAISRICCSRHPPCNKRVFVTVVHGSPRAEGISTGSLRAYESGDHFHERRVPHVVAGSLREPGARVKENQFLRDNNIVPADDQRQIEVIANGLPFWEGKQVAIDTTVVSGHPRGGADKCRRYHELVNGSGATCT